MTSVRWERAELERSRERGAWDRWGVQDAERRDAWLWFAFDQHRIYAPLEHLELPHHFARVATREDALLPFVQQYGRLGWYELASDARPQQQADKWLPPKRREYLRLIEEGREKAVYAEPLDWIQAHARTISWCLAAGHAMRIVGARSRTQRCVELSGQLPRPMGCGSTVRSTPLLREGTIEKVSPLNFVGGMLEDYLWINLRGVRRRVLYVGDGRLRSVWGGNSLLESIYTLVADAVTGGRLAQCQACGAVFLQTDGRQQFCPRREGQDKSSCMNRERVRRYRLRKRKGTRHGKTTRTR
jgi:hypothetical protein